MFDLLVFNQGRGVDAVMLLPIGNDGLSADKWAIGSAMGFTVRQPELLRISR